MKTYRFKNRKEFEEEFGKLWRKQIPFSWPEKMDFLLGKAIDEHLYKAVLNDEVFKGKLENLRKKYIGFMPRQTKVFSPIDAYTIHKSMLTCDEEKDTPQDPHKRQIEDLYKLVTYRGLAIEQLNQKIDQLQAQVDEITVYVPEDKPSETTPQPGLRIFKLLRVDRYCESLWTNLDKAVDRAEREQMPLKLTWSAMKDGGMYGNCSTMGHFKYKITELVIN